MIIRNEHFQVSNDLIIGYHRKGQTNHVGHTGDRLLWQISHVSVYTPTVAANHLQLHFLTICLKFMLHWRSGVYGQWMYKQCMLCYAAAGGKTKAQESKQKEEEMLDVCLPPRSCCSLLYVCMVLTSSEEQVCQVCSGLTFSLSWNIYSPTILIKSLTFFPPLRYILASYCPQCYIHPHPPSLFLVSCLGVLIIASASQF